MSDTADLFEAVYDGLPDARATLRAGRAVISRCVCASATNTGSMSEQGIMLTADITARYLLTSDPADGSTDVGKIVDLTLPTGSAQPYRIAARTVAGGDVVRLTLQGLTD